MSTQNPTTGKLENDKNEAVAPSKDEETGSKKDDENGNQTRTQISGEKDNPSKSGISSQLFLPAIAYSCGKTTGHQRPPFSYGARF